MNPLFLLFGLLGAGTLAAAGGGGRGADEGRDSSRPEPEIPPADGRDDDTARDEEQDAPPPAPEDPVEDPLPDMPWIEPEPEPDPIGEPEPDPIGEPEPPAGPGPVDETGGTPPVSGQFFVSANGSDDASGTLDDPFATIERALAESAPGDVIVVRAGLYEGPVSIEADGTPENPISIVAYPGERPVIDGTGTAPDTDLVTISGSNIVFEGFEVTNATGTGISVWSSQNVTVADNVVHGTESGGIWVGSDGLGISSGHVIEDNVVFDTALMNEATTLDEGWPRAIGVDVTTDSVLSGNVVFMNYGEGIGIRSSTDIVLDANVAYDNYSVQIYLDNTQDIEATDNILFHTGDEEFFRKDSPGIGMLVANEHTEYEMASSGIEVTGNIFGDVRPVFYDDSYGWGGGITDSNFEGNTIVEFEEIDPDWVYSGWELF